MILVFQVATTVVIKIYSINYVVHSYYVVDFLYGDSDMSEIIAKIVGHLPGIFKA